MKTNISDGNPFSFNRYGYSYEVLRQNYPINTHLDFGAGTGEIINSFRVCGVISQGVGVDISDKVEFLHFDRH